MKDQLRRVVQLSQDIGSFNDGPQLRQNIQNSVRTLVQLSTSVKNEITILHNRDDESSQDANSLQQEFEVINQQMKTQLPEIITSLKSASHTIGGPQPLGGERQLSSEIYVPLLDQQELDQDTEQIDLLDVSVNEILTNMREVNNLFTQTMQELQRQRHLVVSIDNQTSKAHDAMKEGNSQLDKASEHQKGSRKAICLIFLVVLVVVIGVGLYFLITYLKKKK